MSLFQLPNVVDRAYSDSTSVSPMVNSMYYNSFTVVNYQTYTIIAHQNVFDTHSDS